jgi:predicted nucleic acid-binding protein
MKSVFVDTNVLLYLVDQSEAAKSLKAREVVTEWADHITLSVQVLQEFYWVSTRKLKLPPSDARALVVLWSQKRVLQPGPELLLQAIDTSERYLISFWDALIVESAVATGCETLLTEDLNHGQVFRGVRVQNPFRA